ncbi:MAG: LytR/AlgR family response regulator transcription factor [Crocinitomicaceae bacterium]
MKTIKAIIIDDEADARKVLSTLIDFSPHPIEIVAFCGNLEQGVAEIKEHRPDVVFLDIQMPKFAGYEIVDFFDEINFEIVFVTAFDQYALKAFELSAIDYLVKPVNRARLNETLKKITETVQQKRTIIEFELLRDSLVNRKSEKIVIPEIGMNRVLKLDDIICIQGQGNYSTIYLLDAKKVTVSKNLKYFERVIDPELTFFRTQKSWIINTEHVQNFNRNKGIIQMSQGIEAKLSINRVKEFDALFANN